MKRLIRRLSRVADSSQYSPASSSTTNTDSKSGDRRRRFSPRVPEGHIPVYVGDEMEWFSVKAELLGSPAIAELLRRSAAEYGYEQRGVLRIPCPAAVFRRLLSILSVAGDGGTEAVDEILRSLPDEIRQL